MSIGTPRSIADEWATRAADLAAWTMERLVNRVDTHGGYYRKDDSTRQTTKKAEGGHDPLTLDRIERHYRAKGTDDVIGLHTIQVEEDGSCYCRFVAIDIDKHGAKGDQDINFGAAHAWHERAESLGFAPLLLDSNGRGGFHLFLIFDRRIPSRLAFAFAKWLTADWESFGLDQVETFPKQPGIAPGKFGSWIRLPGLHHTRRHFTKVWKAGEWLEGEEAIEVIVSNAGTSPDAIPPEARPGKDAPFDLGLDVERKRSQRHAIDLEGGPQRQASEGGVIEPGDDFNAKVDWASILNPHGWQLDHVDEEVGYWRRPGKEAGQSATTNHSGKDTLYVFTDATAFVQHGSYSKFGAYTVLDHGGDFKAAVRALSARGYGVFPAWTWDDEAGDWKAGVHPNPCPRGRGTRVRLRKDGAPKPRGLYREDPGETGTANGHHEANGKAEGPPGLGRSPRVGRESQGFNLTDLGNAERLVHRHGKDLRYCHPWKRWLVWDGRRWNLDNTADARRRARKTVRSIYGEAGSEASEERRKALAKWGMESEKRDRISAMLNLAEAEEGIPILPDTMDRDPWSFNCLNGTIDLRTGALRPHRREDLITKLCPLNYIPGADCPLWDGTLNLFFAGNQGLMDYWQSISGYAMTGVVRDHIMPVAYGKGSNGKSTILGTIMEVYGPDYAMKCPPDMLMAKQVDSHPTDRADLFGKRLVVAIETENGRRLNETMVKELTGGDKIRARRMREDFWEFDPTHTLILATNHKPVIRGTDNGIWRRLRLIPFSVIADGERADKAMPEKLKAEYEGILAWCVEGCKLWLANGGLKEPKDVTDASTGYRKEQDVIGAFLDECVEMGPGGKEKASIVFERYKKWCEGAKEYALSMKAFGMEMEDRGVRKHRSGGIVYEGMSLLKVAHVNHLEDLEEGEIR